MHISENGAHKLKNFEGVRLEAYKCSAGVWTIGVGHTGTVDGKKIQFGMKITKAKSDELFNKDIIRFENYVNKCGLKLNQNEFDALVSFTFNLGQGCLQTLIKNRNKQQIADAMLLYNKAGGKVVDGLVKRRKAERELFLTPCGQVKDTSNQISKDTSKPKVKGSLDKLPCKVKTTVQLNIREAAGTNYPIIRTTKKGEELTVWAIVTSNGEKWGKNGKEYYCLKYCEVI